MVLTATIHTRCQVNRHNENSVNKGEKVTSGIDISEKNIKSTSVLGSASNEKMENDYFGTLLLN